VPVVAGSGSFRPSGWCGAVENMSSSGQKPREGANSQMQKAGGACVHCISTPICSSAAAKMPRCPVAAGSASARFPELGVEGASHHPRWSCVNLRAGPRASRDWELSAVGVITSARLGEMRDHVILAAVPPPFRMVPRGRWCIGTFARLLGRGLRALPKLRHPLQL
jgi:hypothetical protein